MNSLFGSLLYRIFEDTDKWTDDYLESMNLFVDGIKDTGIRDELLAGHQLVNHLARNVETFKAFETLLNQSLYKIVLVDEDFSILYYNKSAAKLYAELLHPDQPAVLKDCYKSKLQQDPSLDRQYITSFLKDHRFGVVYAHPIMRVDEVGIAKYFYFLFSVPDEAKEMKINNSYVEQFGISRKEKITLSYLIRGKSVKQIAASMFISEHTVKTHLKKLFKKTSTNSQVELVQSALMDEARRLENYISLSHQTVTSSCKDKIISTHNGARLYYQEYGAEDGKPVILFHSGYGCRLSVLLSHDAILQQYQRKLIIPDRPGMGRSPVHDQHPDNWNETLLQFMDELQLDTVDVIGNLISCPLAIRFAATYPQRIRQLALVTPIVVNQPDDRDNLLGILAPAARLVSETSDMAAEMYRLWLKSMRLDVQHNYVSMVTRNYSIGEKEFARKSDLTQSLVSSFEEASSCTCQGMADEMVYCLKPLQLDLGAISVPVSCWLGSDNNRYKRDGVDELARSFANGKLFFFADYGEHLYYTHFAQIIEYLSTHNQIANANVSHS